MINDLVTLDILLNSIDHQIPLKLEENHSANIPVLRFSMVNRHAFSQKCDIEIKFTTNVLNIKLV